MAKTNKSIAHQILAAEVAINNSLANPIILDAVTAFGYTQDRLEAARALHAETLDLVARQQAAYGEQFAATQAVRQAQAAATQAYSAALKIARIVFRDDLTAQNALGLSGSRKKSLSGWLDQARRFYNNLLRTPEFVAAMTPYSYTQARLEQEAGLVQTVAVASEMQDKERGKAREVTKQRNAKLDELARWLADYKAVAEVALAASPQKLEQLGWVVAS
ncbi:MAG: hypothetical protein R6X34_15280 [Chloroflexota bacterium]